MAQALAGGIAGGDAEVSFLVSDPSDDAVESFRQRTEGTSVEIASSNADLFRIADIVFLAVKPQYFEAALDRDEIVSSTSGGQAPLVVSIMAGISIARIRQKTFIDAIIRVMPNTPCLVGAGACGMSCSEAVSAEQQQQVTSFLSTTGLVLPVAENLLDAVTGLSGSGPAYIFELIDALALGGVRCGLPRDTAQQLAAQTVFGSAKLVIESGEHPSVLRDRVTSPGGTTIAAIQTLCDNGFKKAVIAAVESSANRSKELGS